MTRTRIELPDHFPFSTDIPVRITDLNYGNHVGNDSILSLLHEARVQYLEAAGYGELDFAGVALIMRDVSIEFRSELFYGTPLKIFVACRGFSRAGFELVYKLEVIKEGKPVLIAAATTGMVCYDYKAKKIMQVPQDAIVNLNAIGK